MVALKADTSSGQEGAKQRNKARMRAPRDKTSVSLRDFFRTEIRPALREDGGNIKVRRIDLNSKKVVVSLLGACSGCPSSGITLYGHVEWLLRERFGEDWSIELV